MPQDYGRALKWYRAAAEQGDADAQFNLGFMYHKGQGTPQDYARAIQWYRAAAEQGDVEAQYTVGELYRDGQGTPQDSLRAYAYFSVAAANGHQDAKVSRGRLAKKLGRGAVLKAQALALRLWSQAEHAYPVAEKLAREQTAAENGNADAQFNLGVMYANGEGMPQVFLQAYAHFSVAAANGDKRAPRMRDKVAKKLLPRRFSRHRLSHANCGSYGKGDNLSQHWHRGSIAEQARKRTGVLKSARWRSPIGLFWTRLVGNQMSP